MIVLGAKKLIMPITAEGDCVQLYSELYNIHGLL